MSHPELQRITADTRHLSDVAYDEGGSIMGDMLKGIADRLSQLAQGDVAAEPVTDAMSKELLPTPRVDKFLAKLLGYDVQYKGKLVDFARTLERELAKSEKRARDLYNAADNFYAMVQGECPSLLEDDHNAFGLYIALEACRTPPPKEPVT